MAYSDKHRLEKEDQAWDGDMSHVAADMADTFAKKGGSTDAIVDGVALLLGLESVAGGTGDGRSAAEASPAMREDADPASGPAQDSSPLLADGADDAHADAGGMFESNLFVRAGATCDQAAAEEAKAAVYAQAERMGSLERALRNYGALQINDAELVDEGERDAGGQAYAEAKRSAFALGRFANRKAKNVADKPSSQRQGKAIERAEAKLARFEGKAAKRRQSRAWGQSKWHEGYSKMQVKRLKKRVQKARVLIKPSRWRWLIYLVSTVGVFALVMLLTVGAIAVIGGIGADQNSGGESLSTSERKVYLYLKGKGLDDAHAAAIMANIRAESGGECGEEFDTGSIEDDGGGGHGLCQWTGGRWNGAGGLLEFSAAQGKPWTDIDVQLDFFWSEYSAYWSGAYTIISGDSPPAGTYVSGSKSGFEAATEVGEATKQFCYGWERAGIPHESKRIRFAHWYLGALSGGGTHEDVLSAAFEIAGNATPYVFGGTDIVNGCDCSYFTQWCYAQVGIDIPRQSEDQMRAGRSIPVSEAQPGDLLWRFGHVGIYVDEDTAVEQTPPCCRITPITYENWTCAVRFE